MYVYKSSLGGSSSLPLSSEIWSGAKNCGSNADGSVQVKCTKLKGKPFEWIIVPHYILEQPTKIMRRFLIQVKWTKERRRIFQMNIFKSSPKIGEGHQVCFFFLSNSSEQISPMISFLGCPRKWRCFYFLKKSVDLPSRF